MNTVLRGAQAIIEDYNLDLRKVDEIGLAGSVEELEDILLSNEEQDKCLKLGKNLRPEIKMQLLNFLRGNMDVFGWAHSDIVGVNPEVMAHCLNIIPSHKPVG